MDSFEHKGYKIQESFNGFQQGNGLYAIQSYVASNYNKGYGFAFCISTLGASIRGFDITDMHLIAKARKTVTDYLDVNESRLVNLDEFTFEYNFEDNTFQEVKDATWWVKFSR